MTQKREAGAEGVWYLDDGTTRPVPVAVAGDVACCVRLRRNGDFVDLFVFVLSDMPKDHDECVAGNLFWAYVVGGSADQAIATAKARLVEWIAAGKWPE